MSAGVRVRRALVRDAAYIARCRAAMFVEMGTLRPGSAEEPVIIAATERLLANVLPSGEWTAWIAEVDGHAVGCGAALLRHSPPRPGLPEGGEMAYLLNFFTDPAFRRRGVASLLVRTCLAWCRARDIVRIELHASHAGRPVYERLGFVPREGEMRWDPAAADGS